MVNVVVAGFRCLRAIARTPSQKYRMIRKSSVDLENRRRYSYTQVAMIVFRRWGATDAAFINAGDHDCHHVQASQRSSRGEIGESKCRRPFSF
jgi:hypothetical protein